MKTNKRQTSQKKCNALTSFLPMKFIITSNFISLLSTSAMPNGFFCCTFTESPVAVCKATDSKSFIVKSIFGLVSFCTSLYFMEILSIPFFCTLFTFTHTQKNEIFSQSEMIACTEIFCVCIFYWNFDFFFVSISFLLDDYRIKIQNFIVHSHCNW